MSCDSSKALLSSPVIRLNALLRRPAMPTKSVRLPDGSKSGVLELRLDHVTAIGIRRKRALRSRFDPRTSGALEVQRARMNLRPHGESLKRDGVPDWIPQLLQNDQEYAAPDGGAMKLSRGPVVVAHHQ